MTDWSWLELIVENGSPSSSLSTQAAREWLLAAHRGCCVVSYFPALARPPSQAGLSWTTWVPRQVLTGNLDGNGVRNLPRC